MSDPNSKPPSLVEEIALLSRFALSMGSHMEPEDDGPWVRFEDVLKIAAPYAARLGGLERVFEAAKDLSDGGETLGGWGALKNALAAVPEIPEKTDGS